MGKVTQKEREAANRHIAKVYAEKSATRKTATTAKYEAPKGPGPSTSKGIDKALANLVKPSRPRS